MTVEKMGPADLLRSINANTYRAAYERGQSLSVYLETQDPSSDYPNSRLDAFGRMLAEAKIRTRSIPEIGLQADTWQTFCEHPQARNLVPEWVARQWRKAAMGQDANTRALYSPADNALGSLGNPYFDQAQARANKMIAPQIPIAQLVALTTPVTGNAYRAFYLEDNASEQRMVRVGPGAEIPGAKLVAGQRTIDLYKYGRKLVATYEDMRHMRIDRIALHIARMAVQAEIDKLATLLDVIVNGDGNANTAATSYNLTTLDTGTTANNLTVKGYLSFKMKFANPYMMDTALAQEAGALSLQLLNLGSANVPLVSVNPQLGFGGFRPINPQLRDTVALGWTADAPSGKVVGFDSRFAVERLFEVGANIQEVQRWTTNQTETLTMTETEGYAVLDQNASKVLDLAA